MACFAWSLSRKSVLGSGPISSADSVKGLAGVDTAAVAVAAGR